VEAELLALERHRGTAASSITTDVAQFEVGSAVGEHAGAAVRAGVDPRSSEALTVIEQLEARTPGDPENRAKVAERIEAFTDRRVTRASRRSQPRWPNDAAATCTGNRAPQARTAGRRPINGSPGTPIPAASSMP